MRIVLDKRLELLFTALFLSDYQNPGFCVSEEDHITRTIKERFGKYSSHRAIAGFSSVWDTKINWDAMPYCALSLDSDYSLMPDADTEYVGYWLLPDASLHDFIADLQDFAVQSNFEEYFLELEQRLSPYLQKLNDVIAKRRVLPILEEYLGFTFPKTTVLLSTLMKPFMSITFPQNSNTEVFCICSRQGLEVAEQHGGLERVLLSAIWHEFSHHVINPLTFGRLPEPDHRTQEQVEWCCALNESIIWAINTRLLIHEKIVADKDIVWMVENAVRNNAPQTQVMHDLLCEYEKNRHIFKTISDIHPRLFEAFGK